MYLVDINCNWVGCKTKRCKKFLFNVLYWGIWIEQDSFKDVH